MTPEEKEKFYRQEFFGEPLVEYIGFRCTKRLATWLKTQGMIEAKDHSSVRYNSENSQKQQKALFRAHLKRLLKKRSGLQKGTM